MTVVQFVKKLLAMLQQQSETVKWISNGTQFEITDVQTFTHKVLPQHFRHKKFGSFIRQLNMYGFHKVNRRKNSYIYEHEYFIQGFEQNYRLIKRAKKVRSGSQFTTSLNKQVKAKTIILNQKAPKMAEFLNKLIQFNTQNQFDHRQLKSKLDLLAKQVPAKREKLLKPVIKNIREKMVILDQVQKKVAAFNWSSLTSYPQVSPTKSNNEQIEKGSEREKKVMSAPVFIFKNPQEPNKYIYQGGGSLNQIHSFGSISSFIVLG